MIPYEIMRIWYATIEIPWCMSARTSQRHCRLPWLALICVVSLAACRRNGDYGYRTAMLKRKGTLHSTPSFSDIRV